MGRISLRPADRQFLAALSELSHCNPFEPRRLELERQVLGEQYVDEDLVAWSRTSATDEMERENVERITSRAVELVERLWQQQSRGQSLRARDVPLYDDLVSYVLYYRYFATIRVETPADDGLAERWQQFRADRRRLLAPLDAPARAPLADTAHLFACLHQVRRAFGQIFACLIGESQPANTLRAQVWQSIFTHDLRRYRRLLFGRMGHIATLITGPSGTGKELVARAIGLSQYRAFREKTQSFAPAAATAQHFAALNLTALSPTLIESELFGHRKGAFTGAVVDRVGWFEQCPAFGAVFLDEVGEIDTAIQVKLLRLVQSREFSRLGETKPRQFAGKLITATNRDLAREMRAGRFREDFYYRLCSDRIELPSLRDQLVDRPDALRGLVQFIVRRELTAPGAPAEQQEIDTLTIEVETWIKSRMPRDYQWPGNIRELEQCVRNVLVRSEYHPEHQTDDNGRSPWLARAERGELSADDLLNHYCRHVHHLRGGYDPAARTLGIDRRTVKNRIENLRE